MDMLAERLGMSPLELRRKNLLRDGDRFATGEVMHDVHFEECLQAAADAVGYEQRPARQGPVRAAQGHADPEPRGRSSVERTPVGYVVRTASCEMGQGVRRSLQLMAAELLGCEPGQVEVPDPDTDSSPFDTRTTSSRSTHMMGRALVEAVADLRPTAASAATARSSTRAGSIPTPARASPRRTGTRAPRGAHVSVDEETGELTVEHLHGVVYAGPGGQPAGAELQNEGSMIMGLGTALLRGDRASATARSPNANLSDYSVPAPGRPARALHARDHRARGRRGARAWGDRAAARAGGDRQRARVARPARHRAADHGRARPRAATLGGRR